MKDLSCNGLLQQKKDNFKSLKVIKTRGKNLNNQVSGGGLASNLSEMSYKISVYYGEWRDCRPPSEGRRANYFCHLL